MLSVLDFVDVLLLEFDLSMFMVWEWEVVGRVFCGVFNCWIVEEFGIIEWMVKEYMGLVF